MKEVIDMNTDILAKEQVLKEILAKQRYWGIAYSGGVDSTYLLTVAAEVPGLELIALTVDSVFLPRSEMDDASQYIESLNVKWEILHMDPLSVKEIQSNSRDRCYYCKYFLFNTMQSALPAGYILADGSNIDDLGDYRPGMRACEELGVRHPLIEAGFYKADIYALSQYRAMPSGNKAAFACLASRVPYGEELTEEKLYQIERGEAVLQALGFRQYRLRHHGDIARIEVSPEEISLLLSTEVRERLQKSLQELGFRFVTADLGGYVMGGMNR